MKIYKYHSLYSTELFRCRGEELEQSFVECVITKDELEYLKDKFTSVQDLLGYLYRDRLYEKEFAELINIGGFSNAEKS